MTSQEKQADTIKVLVVCILSLWSFVSAEATDLSQAAIGKNESPTFVTWPEKGLGLSIDLTGFVKDIDQVKEDGRRYLTASHPKTGLNLSITLEKIQTQATTQGCREQLQLIKEGPLVAHGHEITLHLTGEVPTLEYTLRKFRGVRLDQKSLYACMARDNVYADIQISKTQYTAADAPLFQSILTSLRLILTSLRLQPEPSKIIEAKLPAPPKIGQIQPPTPPSSRELLDIGNALYRQNKYAQAISPYQKAFDLEKTEPQLDRTQWRVLIDQLGMAYEMTGRLKEAKSTFQEGIQADPTYPMFHYHLACTFADMNDLDHAMQSLTIAFRHRKNQNPGDKGMPDPRQNLSFQHFMKNETFRNLVNDLTPSKS